MIRYSFLLLSCVAACIATPAWAQPELQLVDNGDLSVTLQILVDDNGSIATELTAVDGGLLGTGDIKFLDAYIADPATFDIANPGNNPITGTVTDGLYLDALATNEVFASFGSMVLTPGTYDFLTIEYMGVGTIDAFGIVAPAGSKLQPDHQHRRGARALDGRPSGAGCGGRLPPSSTLSRSAAHCE